MSGRIDRYWQQFVTVSPELKPDHFVEAYWFGIEPQDAKGIAQLVMKGIKIATGSILWSLEHDGKPIPKVGDYNIVTDGYDHPLCIVLTTQVRILPLNEVDAQFAFDGGEGDRTLAGWRDIYWRYLQSECIRIGREPTWQAPIICERFRVMYQDALEG